MPSPPPAIDHVEPCDRRAARASDLRLFVFAWAAGFLFFLILLG